MSPASPIPAVAALLWRPTTAGGVEVLLGRRRIESRFFGGFWSIPGGTLEPEDREVTVRGAGGPRAYQIVAAARELREELGAELPLEAGRFEYAGRWITPEFSPIRFDATYFLVKCPDETNASWELGDGELDASEWTSPADAVARFERGEWLMPTPVVRVLRACLPDMSGAAARCEQQAAEEAAAPRLYELASGVAVCPVRTPTLPPATHTNCYVVGTDELVVIDPASPYEDQQDVLDRALDECHRRGQRVREILLTHHHPDHVGGAVHLARRLGVGIAAHPVTAELLRGTIEIDRTVDDGDIVDLPGSPPRRLRAVFTPGHAAGHLCFLEEHTGLLVAGDMVASVGSIVVDPDEGDMSLYLESLARLKSLASTALLPAHGLAIADPTRKLDEYVEHRLWRERKVLAAVERAGRGTTADLVPDVYDDVPVALYGLAERSLLAHLQKLERDGRVARTGTTWLAGKRNSP